MAARAKGHRRASVTSPTLQSTEGSTLSPLWNQPSTGDRQGTVATCYGKICESPTSDAGSIVITVWGKYKIGRRPVSDSLNTRYWTPGEIHVWHLRGT